MGPSMTYSTQTMCLSTSVWAAQRNNYLSLILLTTRWQQVVKELVYLPAAGQAADGQWPVYLSVGQPARNKKLSFCCLVYFVYEP